MNEVLADLDFISYLDDILIFSENETEHVKLVFERLNKYDLNINQSKSLYGQHTIEFLGHEISETRIKPLGRKVKVILVYPRPEN